MINSRPLTAPYARLSNDLKIQFGDLTKLCDVKWGKSGSTGNQNRLRRFSSDKMSIVF